ncbi:glutathione-dependent formaldehyde-activating GFA [Chytridium lagenaria]|nr:glutathione-dependent formaldehyde-activating GFA [Chytridium lagenaria]
MPLLKGSCLCKRVTFACASYTPSPYMRCYCSLCRKTAGAGGYAINIMGQRKTLKVEGTEHLTLYQHQSDTKSEPSKNKRYFCKHCSSPMWCMDDDYPDWFWPFASAVDTPLTKPKTIVHIFVGSMASWVDGPSLYEGEGDAKKKIENGSSFVDKEGVRHMVFEGYPELSIKDFHLKHGLYAED